MFYIFILLYVHKVVQAPLSEPSMVSWAPLFTPNPGTVVKDMDVVGDHCVLVARAPAGELVLIVFPLTHPKEAYTVQVSVTEHSFSFFAHLVHSPAALKYTLIFLHSQAPLLGLCHRNQESRHG